MRSLFIIFSALALFPIGATYAQNTAQAPAIRLCENQKQLRGIWALARVIESPEGKLSQDYAQNPHQYMRFRANGVFEMTKHKRHLRNKRRIRTEMGKVKDVWQYVIGEQGLIYFYKNQIFSHSSYCGKVTKGSKAYQKGSIIITPSEAAGGQAFQVFQPHSKQPANSNQPNKK